MSSVAIKGLCWMAIEVLMYDQSAIAAVLCKDTINILN